MISMIEDLAWRILQARSHPSVRCRLFQDVLKKSISSKDLQEARYDLEESISLKELKSQQWPDGGWGAFHSQNTSLRQRIPTTEAGVERALSLGLDPTHPILKKATNYIQAIMDGQLEFPDHEEKNDRFPVGKRLFLSSTLSLIHPHHPSLKKDQRLWAQITRRAFQSGVYNQEDEIRAHNELTKVKVKGSYLMLGNKYQLNILGSKKELLPLELEKTFLEWLGAKKRGIGYLGVPLLIPPLKRPSAIDNWFLSWEMLSCLFSSWVDLAQPAIEWLLEERDREGLWDFGPRPGFSVFLPLSPNWRSRENRIADWTTRVLILLRRYYDGLHS